MNITNLEFAQATLEIFGALICLLTIIIITFNEHNTKSIKMIKQLFATTSVIFIMESIAYICRGNVDPTNIFLTKMGNFFVFLFNFVLTSLFIRYVYSLLEEKNIKLNSIYRNIVDICALSAIGILLVSQFNNWMYYFDEFNYYHRNIGWYIYTALSVALPVVTFIIGIKYRKHITKSTFIALILYVLAPFIAIIIQSLYYGIAIVNLGIAVCLFVMLFVYLYEWNAGQIIDVKEKERNMKYFQSIALFIVMVMILSVSIVSCILSMQRIMEKNSESDHENIAFIIGEKIDNEFIKSKSVSQTMAKDYDVIQFLTLGEKQDNFDLVAYLNSIQKGFGYDMVYVVSEQSKAYYTAEQMIGYLDVDDPVNRWYNDFKNSGRDIDLNVDIDKPNNWGLSIFTNARVLDKNGKLIGVCGLGRDLNDLEELISSFEEQYNVRIYLIDENGIVQLSTDKKEVLQKVLDKDYYSNVNADSFTHKKIGNESYLAKYMQELDWYVVIQYNPTSAIALFDIVSPSILIYVIGVIMMGIVFSVFTIRERHAFIEMEKKKKASQTDDLTGLGNRRAYNVDIETINNNPIEDDLVVILIDINSLKKVNDTIGHVAGDELIVGTAKCLNMILAEFGKLYRIGGDEFVAILNCSNEQLMDALKTLDHVVDQWDGNMVHELSISKGVVEYRENPGFTYKEMISLADQRMYDDKRNYYMEKEKN